MKKHAPEYVRLIRQWQEEVFPGKQSNVDFATASGIDKGYIEAVRSGRLVPTREVANKMVAALKLSAAKKHQLIEAVAHHWADTHPKEAEREDRWVRFHIVNTYDTPRWEVFKSEMEEVLSLAHTQGSRFTMEELIAAERETLKSDYSRVLAAQHSSAAALARALLEVTGLKEHDAAALMEVEQTYLHRMLFPDGKAHAVKVRSESWPDFADALMLGEFSLKAPFLEKLAESTRGGFRPRALDEIIDELRADDKDPTVGRILVGMAEDRVGDARPFNSFKQIEEKAGMKSGIIRRLQEQNLTPRTITFTPLCDAMEIKGQERERLNEMQRLEYKAKYASKAGAGLR
jgi:hypothetical protein